MKKITLFIILMAQSIYSYSQIIGPSVTELNYQYTAKFQIPTNSEYKTDIEKSEFHATHLFGLFQTSYMIKKFGLPSDLIEGIGAPRSQMKIKIISSQKISDQLTEIEYENKGQMILHKHVAEIILQNGTLTVQLPANPYLIFDKQCTDTHYDTFVDYWYFYDIYKKGCEYLSGLPFSKNVQIQMTLPKNKKMDQTVHLPEIRGDNGNGGVFSIAFVQGFSDDIRTKGDSGRENFNETNEFLLSQGFTLNKTFMKSRYPFYLFKKEIVLTNGKKIQIEVQHLLVETAIESKSKVFAQFFKDSVKNADVIIYAGHSGLGGNLDLPSLEQKVGQFEFNQNKKQIFYFDSCSSYSYYLEHFKVEKTKAKIDIVTNGLSSYFNTAKYTMHTFLGYLIRPEAADVLWLDLLTDMESKLQGSSYLLNVGGI